jgi:hypothetical protein
MRGLRLMVCAVAAMTLPGHAAENPLEADRSAIVQAVLNDARTRWQEPLPCLSDHLISAGDGRDTPQLISGSLGVKSPFAPCSSARPGDRYLAISEPVIKGDTADVELDYLCPLCGEGNLYSLEHRNGRWQVVGRHPSWIS